MSQQQFQQPQNVGSGFHVGGRVQAGFQNNNCQPPCPPKNNCAPRAKWSSRRCEGKSKEVCPQQLMNPCPPDPCMPQQQVCTPIGNQITNGNQQFQQQQHQQFQQQQQQQFQQQQQQQQFQQQQQYDQQQIQQQYSGQNFSKVGGKLDITDPDNRHTTVVNIGFGGSLSQFVSSGMQPKWTPKSLDMFSDMGDLSKVVVLEIKLRKYQNTFPFPVGLVMEGFEGMIHTDNGKVLVNMYGNSNEIVKEQHLWYPKKVATSLIMQNYGHMKPESIRNGIVKIPDETYSLVSDDHAIPRIIKLNEGRLNVNLARFPVRNKYHVIQNDLIERCIDELNTQVFSKIGDIITDFNNLSAVLVRTDGSEWDDTDTIPGIGNKNSQVIQNIRDSYNVVNVELSIQYAYASSNNNNE